MAALALLGLGAEARAGEVCRPPSEQTTGHGAVELAVGYVDAPPLAWKRDVRQQAPAGVAVDVLKLLAEKNGWRLHFQPLGAENLVASVAGCKLDLGIAPRLPAAVWKGHEGAVDRTEPYFETVAAVALREGAVTTGAGAGHAPRGRVAGFLASVLRALLAAAVGLSALVLLVGLANLRVPRTRGRLLPERWRLVAMDSTVASLGAALRWLWSSRGGRVLLGLWMAGAVALALAHVPSAADAAEAKQATQVQALERALEGLPAVGVRPGGRTVDCPRVAACLEDLARGDLVSVAGGVDTLCHHVRAGALDGIHFAPNLLWPEAHAYLVPPGAALRRLLNAGLTQLRLEDPAALAAIHERYGAPWKAPTLAATCPPAPEATR